jgi:hypothetical protein
MKAVPAVVATRHCWNTAESRRGIVSKVKSQRQILSRAIPGRRPRRLATKSGAITTLPPSSFRGHQSFYTFSVVLASALFGNYGLLVCVRDAVAMGFPS